MSHSFGQANTQTLIIINYSLAICSSQRERKKFNCNFTMDRAKGVLGLGFIEARHDNNMILAIKVDSVYKTGK